MRSSRAISGFVATLILVTITLSLSYVVFEGVSRLAPPKSEVFSNQAFDLGGSPGIEEYQVNASSPDAPQALEADSSGSRAGILYFDGANYGTTQRLCLPRATTFFSVLAPSPGPIQVLADGRVWIDGYGAASLTVGVGWHEVMISDSTTCRVTGNDGRALSFPDTDISSVPFTGSTPSGMFSLYVPTDGLRHSFVLVFDGGYDRLA